MRLVEQLRAIKNQALTPDELGAILKVLPRTVRDWAEEGVIPAFKANKQWRYDPQAVADYIESTQNAHNGVTKENKNSNETGDGFKDRCIGRHRTEQGVLSPPCTRGPLVGFGRSVRDRSKPGCAEHQA